MKLIVGLGNPGKKYEKTRHNIGFRVIDQLADLWKIDVDKQDFKGLFGRGKIKGEDVVLFKPQTFMNLSGEAVLMISQFYKIDHDDILIIFDDLSLPPGKVRLRLNGSSGGQKGMQNTIDLLGSNNIKRIKIGIGEPEFADASDHVLGKPSKEEIPLIEEGIKNAVAAVGDVLETSFDHAMAKFN